MREKGRLKAEVVARLRETYQKSLKYKDGQILSSMCTSPHPLAKSAHELFFDANLGDPGLFPEVVKLEREAVASLAQLLHAPDGYTGFIVSGGTEANLLSLTAARNQANVTDPEVVMPESVHFSFDKLCNLLRIKPIKAAVDETFRTQPSRVERLISKRTIAIVANAGSTELGVVDPIEELSDIALRHGVPLHVDASFGGLVLPFLKEMGYPSPMFDFELAGVQSITVDPHKMGMSTIPAGGIMFRDNSVLQYIRTETPYLTESEQYTFVGTRCGGSAAATWATFEVLGREGFDKTVAGCMKMTSWLYEGLEAAGFEVLLRPSMNVLAFRSTNTKLLADKLLEHGWYVSYVPRLNCVRVVLMPHTTKRHLQAFLRCVIELGAQKL